MKKHFLLIFIFLFAFILRFWELGNFPSSLDWDEASLGYNAYSILKAGRDEYGVFLPLSIRSFGDYKPPLYTYLTIFPVALFDLNEYAVRFPSAFLGTISVVAVYFLILRLNFKQKIALLTSFFLGISPWALQFSRVAFETNVSLSLLIFALLFY